MFISSSKVSLQTSYLVELNSLTPPVAPQTSYIFLCHCLHEGTRCWWGCITTAAPHHGQHRSSCKDRASVRHLFSLKDCHVDAHTP